MADLKKLTRSLTVRERLELIGSLWDSITDEVGDAPEMADAERDELDRRIEAHRADPENAVSWESARSRRP
jgi:putative addiction module component (TIGR02574 family)